MVSHLFLLVLSVSNAGTLLQSTKIFLLVLNVFYWIQAVWNPVHLLNAIAFCIFSGAAGSPHIYLFNAVFLACPAMRSLQFWHILLSFNFQSGTVSLAQPQNKLVENLFYQVINRRRFCLMRRLKSKREHSESISYETGSGHESQISVRRPWRG